MHLEKLKLEDEGAQLFSNSLSLSELAAIEQTLAMPQQISPGVRLSNIAELRSLLCSAGPIGSIPASILGARCRPVRAIVFDKSAHQNWSLGWHQDRTIVVQKRVETSGFGPWSIKGGMVHVEPPFDLLAKMLTLRIHIDPAPATNAPLLIAPKSQTQGRIPTPNITDVVRQCGIVACLAQAGDIWLYATPILHASEASLEPQRRRVLQVDYCAESLPKGLTWHGV